MEFLNLIAARRSIRSFTPQPVEEAKLRVILEAARRAPSAGNLQGYEILLVRDLPRRQALVKAALGQEFLAHAPVVLAFLADPHRSAAKYRRRGASMYCLQDASIACAFAHLAAVDLGLGSVWVGAFDDTAVMQALDVRPDLWPVALLPIGYPAETPGPTGRRPIEELVKELR
jgi:nitroreductase